MSEDGDQRSEIGDQMLENGGRSLELISEFRHLTSAGFARRLSVLE